MKLTRKKWRYIAFLVKRAIASGKFELNDRLPPEREMSETYEVSRGTIRKALTYLEQQGLVEIRPNSGTYVVNVASSGEISPV